MHSIPKLGATMTARARGKWRRRKVRTERRRGRQTAESSTPSPAKRSVHHHTPHSCEPSAVSSYRSCFPIFNGRNVCMCPRSATGLRKFSRAVAVGSSYMTDPPVRLVRRIEALRVPQAAIDHLSGNLIRALPDSSQGTLDLDLDSWITREAQEGGWSPYGVRTSSQSKWRFVSDK